MAPQMLLTPEGIEKLTKELLYLKKQKRPEITERIKHAKEFGDLSENAEYYDAKQEQGFVEGRIIEIEQILKTAHVVNTIRSREVNIGSTVTVKDDAKQLTVHIVGATESDPLHGKISVDSPLGQALIGKKEGDMVTLKVADKVLMYTVKHIR